MTKALIATFTPDKPIQVIRETRWEVFILSEGKKTYFILLDLFFFEYLRYLEYKLDN